MGYKKQGGKRRTQKDYTVAFKLQVVAEIERGDLSKNVAKYKYGIQGRSTILKWLKKYGTLDWNKPELHILSKPQEPQTPEQRIKELEALLEQEKQKNLLLNTIVSIAEKDYGLQIRKKSSPVQSNSSNQEN